MGRDKIRHLREINGAFYFQPSKSMRAGGLVPESLGKDPIAARARAMELNALWDDIRSDKKKKRPPQTKHGSFAHLIAEFKTTDRYKAVWKPPTRSEFDYCMDIVEKTFGDSQLTAITARRFERYYRSISKAYSTHKAHRLVKWTRFVLERALLLGYIETNPTAIVRNKGPKPRKQIWAPDQIAAHIKKACEMGYYGLAIAVLIAYDTSLRPVDIRGMRIRQLCKDAEGRYFDLTQTKTALDQQAPIDASTAASIDDYLKTRPALLPDAYLIVTRTGRPYTKDKLAQDFRTVRDALGLPADLQMRDIRRTATIEAAEGGASAAMMAAATGHKIDRSARILDTYTPKTLTLARGAKAARKERMAHKKLENGKK